MRFGSDVGMSMAAIQQEGVKTLQVGKHIVDKPKRARIASRVFPDDYAVAVRRARVGLSLKSAGTSFGSQTGLFL
jgi:hypothetical protein